METYENTFQSVCRICLSHEEKQDMVSLVENSSPDGLSCYGKAVNFFSNISLNNEDKFPTMMCQNCTNTLRQAIYFKLKSELSDRRLKRLVSSNLSKGLQSENIKEIICEYTLFNHYFPQESSLEETRCRTTVKTENILHCETTNISDSSKVASNEKYEHYSDGDQPYDDDANDHTTESMTSEQIDSIFDAIEKQIPKICHVSNKRNNKRRQIINRKQTSNFTCKICNRELANALTYNHHMQRHSQYRFICDQCGRGFPVLAGLHQHQIARHGIGPYLQCEHCPYKATRKLNLIEHLRLHTGERPFTCDKCGLTFRRQAIWRNHLVYHTEKTFQCTSCPRKFYRQSSLLAHSNNIHERVYVYMCKICNVTYAKTESVKKHMLVKHGIPREKQGKIMRVNKGGNNFPVN